MKRLFYILIFVLFIDFTFHQCANPGRPTGGPKDTIPPTLIYANPTNGTINFSGETIELEFSEYINADKLKQQLIITPKTSITYKSIVKKNRLVLKLNSKLDDSTTYNFNFANGVTDITEKNPIENLSIALSTQSYIDSMSVRGSVEELMTQKPGKGYVVGLYPFSDTLDYFTQNPIYFTTANDSGNFKLDYIKTGKYKIIAFNDNNKNFLLDSETESHGFLSDTIKLDSPISIRPIRCVLQNVKPLKLINARPIGPYVEIKFNKQVDTYQLLPSNLSSNIIGENKDLIRIYKPESVNYKDSIQTIVIASDSLGDQVNDTIKYVFIESNRKPATFSYSFNSQKIDLVNNPSIQLSFNKPILTIDTAKLLLKADSTFSYNPKLKVTFNENRTEASIQFSFIADSIKSAYKKSQPRDTANSDSLNIKSAPRNNNLSFSAERGAFITIENDSSSIKTIKVTEPSKPKSGSVNISLTTDRTHYTVQLINKQNTVAYSVSNQKVISFSSIKTDTYKIRILIDSNKDNNWSFGNLLKNEEPEEIYLFPEETSVRENWVIDLSIIF